MSMTSPIIAIFLMALTGCVSTGTAWNRAGATAEQFATDKAACRSYAHRDEGNTYFDRAGFSGAGGVNNDTQYNVLMQRYDARHEAQAQFERCLMRRGYRRVDPNVVSQNI